MNQAGAPESRRADAGDARAALQAAARRCARLVASIEDMASPVHRSSWTVGEAAAHLVVALRGFTDAATGEAGRWREQIPDVGRYPERLGGLNAATIAAEPTRDPKAAGHAITEAADAYLSATAALPPDHAVPTPWYGPDATLAVSTATCLLLGEQVVHGYDIAKAVKQKWPIDAADAVLVFEAIKSMFPIAADPDAIAGLSATYEIRVGRQSRFAVRIDDGRVEVGAVEGRRIDCHIVAEPVALLLIGYGRLNQWRAIAGGKVFTWGRKPWLGVRFVGLFFNP